MTNKKYGLVFLDFFDQLLDLGLENLALQNHGLAKVVVLDHVGKHNLKITERTHITTVLYVHGIDVSTRFLD